MLFRVAGNFYWMGRYVERSAFTASLLSNQITEVSEAPTEYLSASWKSVFHSLKAPENESLLPDSKTLDEKTMDNFLLANAYAFVDYFTFERSHPYSILSQIFYVRENVRQNQEQLTSSIPPLINSYYNKLKNEELSNIWPDKIIDLYKEVEAFNYLFQGMIQDSMYQELSVDFIKMGLYIERFQNLAGFLINYISHLILSYKDEEPDLISLLLRYSAFDRYRQVHSLNLTLKKVLDFLFYDKKFSRSFQYSLQQIKQSLYAVEGQKINKDIKHSLNGIEKILKGKQKEGAIVHFLKQLDEESAKLHDAVNNRYLDEKLIVFTKQDQQ